MTAVAFLEDLIDACVMEREFLTHLHQTLNAPSHH